MERERARDLAATVLGNLHSGQGVWPLSLVTGLYVFGSFARGALAPHDLDMDVEFEHDDEWISHFVTALSNGRDPHSPMRRMLTGGKRGCQFTFNFREQADFDLTMLWHKGDSLAAALARLDAIGADPAAGRAPRDAMLAQFEGIDGWVPRPYREALVAAVHGGAVSLERLRLTGQPYAAVSPVAAGHLAGRWKQSSPLFRAGAAVVGDWERRGIDPGRCHLHGADIRDRETPWFAGFGWRYFRSVPACLTEFGGVEWIEVVRPTLTRPLECLRIVPLDARKLREAAWD